MDSSLNSSLLNYIKQVKSLAEAGLVYATNNYDRERYETLQQLSFEMLSALSGESVHFIGNFFKQEKDYPTPKVDVRGIMVNENNEILLVKEAIDGCWSLPGGWGEIGFSPTEGIKKEIKEETGLDAEVVRLLAVYDKKCHPYPPQPFYVYKLVFFCKAKGTLNPCFEIEEAKWFSIDNLPPISRDRILPEQIKELYRKVITHDTTLILD
ncbi:NUDIX hydrolase [Parabacteroides pacaensis]|uniref:NUDIX hydrolase n=1 Tax=Parabacteroides pacaensis TaxID=2086575 RepID=UPI000D0E80CF|nr:NUDIX hydrolase [Parabacteroides pacaensis]